MKLLQLLLCIFVFGTFARSQFNFGQQFPPDTFTGSLLDVSFVDEYLGFAVGAYGTILRTNDGGVTWNYIDSPTVEWLNSVTFLDANRGYIAGTNGALYRTDNGGTDWDPISPTSIVGTDNLNVIYFYDYNFGVVCGDNSMAYTTNGGLVWNASFAPAGGGAYVDVDFIHPDTGIVILNDNKAYVTLDGAANWFDSTPSLLDFEPRSVDAFSTQHVVIAGGYGEIIYSFDDVWYDASVPFLETFYGMDFIDEWNGLVVGSNHTVLQTTDGGANWSDVGLFLTGDFYAVDYIAPNIATAVGSNESIYRSPIGSDLTFEEYVGIDQACENSSIDVVVNVKNHGPQVLNGGAFTISGYGGSPVVVPWMGMIFPGTVSTINLGPIIVTASTPINIAFSGDTETTNNLFTHFIDVFEKDPAGSLGPYAQCANGTTEIQVYGGLSYKWLNLDNPADSTSPVQVVQPDSTTTYFVLIEQDNCSFIEPVVVNVANANLNCSTTQDFAFSPNYDGVNDYFFFEGIPSGPNVFNVYDRWGGKINQVIDYNNEDNVWEGKNMENQEVIPGTYFYTLEILDTGYRQTGWIQVVK